MYGGRGRLFGLLAIAAVIASSVVATAAQGALPPRVRPFGTSIRPIFATSELTITELTTSGEKVGTFVECRADRVKGSLAPTKGTQASTLEAVTIGAELCAVRSSGGKEVPGCSVRDSVNKKNGSFETNKLNGKFVWLRESAPPKESEEEAGVVFWPAAEGSSPTGKEPLDTIEITGAECSAAGTYAFKGSVVGKVTSPAVGSKATTMTLEFPTKPITTYYESESPRVKHSAGLRVGEQTANMSSVEKVGLESKEEFGVFAE